MTSNNPNDAVNRWGEVESRFYNGYPAWLNEEKADRRSDPTLHLDYKPVYTEVGFITPAGEIKSYRYYHMAFRRGLALEDYANCIRFLEDRYMIFLPKSGFLNEMVNAIDEVDLKNIRQKLTKTIRKKRNENTKK